MKLHSTVEDIQGPMRDIERAAESYNAFLAAARTPKGEDKSVKGDDNEDVRGWSARNTFNCPESAQTSSSYSMANVLDSDTRLYIRAKSRVLRSPDTFISLE